MSGWTVVYYSDERGWFPVLEFLSDLPLCERAAVVHDIKLLEEFGLQTPGVLHVEGSLWEIKSGAERIFYATYTGKRFVLLHGYKKKSQKAPRREIETAKRRLVDFRERDR